MDNNKVTKITKTVFWISTYALYTSVLSIITSTMYDSFDLPYIIALVSFITFLISFILFSCLIYPTIRDSLEKTDLQSVVNGRKKNKINLIIFCIIPIIIISIGKVVAISEVRETEARLREYEIQSEALKAEAQLRRVEVEARIKNPRRRAAGY